MKIKVKEVTRQVGLLTDPTPGWMALVDHGACQTPFNSVKRDAGNPTNEQETEVSKAGKGAKHQHVVVKITLSKSLYPTEGDAIKVLEDNSISDYTLSSDDDVWIAKSNTDHSTMKLDKPRSTATKVEGMTAFVAEVTGAADPVEEPAAEATQEAKGATKAKLVDGQLVTKTEATPDTVLRFATGVAKYDMWSSMMANEGSLLGVIEKGMDYDGIPPGVDEVITAAYYTIGNILSSDEGDKETKLRQLGDDLSTLTFGLYELFAKATALEPGSDAAKKAEEFVKSFKASIEEANEGGWWDEVRRTKGKKKPYAEMSDEEKAVEDAAKAAETAAKADTGASDNVIETPAGIPELLATLTENILSGVNKTLDERLSPITERLAIVETNVETTAKAVDETLARSQTRRSFSDTVLETVEEDDASNADKAEKARLRVREVSALMGVAPRANG